MKWLPLFFLCFQPLFANPFLIEVEEKNIETENEWVEIQKKLRSVQLNDVIQKAYPLSKKTSFFRKKEIKDLSDFQGRITRGIRLTLIDPLQDKKPEKTLFKINEGGEYCIVSFASFGGTYTDQMKTIPKELEKAGFNGYFLALTGGFPNPTGKEIKWCGVPYCFKIFAMQEAEKLGFNKVLWIDAAMEVLNDPTPLFHFIEKTDSLIRFRKNGKRYLLPQTRDILLQETGSDMYQTKSARAQVIGLHLKAPHVKQFIQEYTHLVSLGTPFMSCFPEEFVFGALFAKNPDQWKNQPFEHLVIQENKLHGKTKEAAQKENYFFLLRNH